MEITFKTNKLGSGVWCLTTASERAAVAPYLNHLTSLVRWTQRGDDFFAKNNYRCLMADDLCIYACHIGDGKYLLYGNGMRPIRAVKETNLSVRFS